MKKIDRSTILSICSIQLFVAGIITFAAGGQNTIGFLFTTTGFLFLTVGISFRRREDVQYEEKADDKKTGEEKNK